MLRQLARRIDAFQERVGRFASFVVLGMVLVVFADVVMRYGLGKSTVFMQEMEWHLFAISYMVAGRVHHALRRARAGGHHLLVVAAPPAGVGRTSSSPSCSFSRRSSS